MYRRNQQNKQNPLGHRERIDNHQQFHFVHLETGLDQTIDPQT
jgi:hypothetical protein